LGKKTEGVGGKIQKNMAVHGRDWKHLRKNNSGTTKITWSKKKGNKKSSRRVPKKRTKKEGKKENIVGGKHPP